MAEVFEQDLQALKQWHRKAWRSLADASLVPFERRELRNYLKEVEAAIHAV